MDLKKEKFWAMACHLSTFVGFLGIVPFGNFLMPLVIWLIFRDESTRVDDQGRESLNFQFSIFVYTVIFVMAVLGIGVAFFGVSLANPIDLPPQVSLGLLFAPLALLVLSMLGSCVLVVIAAVQAQRGRLFRYPLTIRVF